jgi:hypothetical protein
MIEFAIGPTHHGTVPPAATAVSEEAQAVEHDLADSFNSLLRTSTYVEPREQVFRELEAVAEECAVHNWDCYDAQPVSARAIGCAWKLLDQLVDDFPRPEVSADPDGEVSLDWLDGVERGLSISVNAEGRLSYAGFFGRSKAHGVEFLQDEIPEGVMEALRRFAR